MPSNHDTAQTARRWGAPPAPTMDPGEPFIGHGVLREEGEDRMAIALFVALRRASDRAATEPAARGSTPKKPYEEMPHDAPAALQLLLDPELAARSPVEIARACLDLSRWAAERDRPRTRRGFARVAALVAPEDAEAALVAAESYSDAEHRDVAEVWLLRAVVAARRAKDWTRYVQAYLHLARLHLAAGARESARAALLKAFRAARRGGLRPLRAEVMLLAQQHDLHLLRPGSGRTGTPPVA